MGDVSDQLKSLSRGPNTVSWRFSGNVINGYRFYTKQRDARCTTQNSGVTFESITTSVASSKDDNPIIELVTYYGSITEIIEVDYYGNFKFVLFRCDWFEVEDDMGWYAFTSTRDIVWKILLYWLLKSVNASIFKILSMQIGTMLWKLFLGIFFFNLQEQSESNAQQSFLSEPSDHALNLSENDENCEIELVRNDMH